MEKKYIIKLEENEIAYKTVNSNGCPMIGLLHPVPYTEPDLEQVRKEAYQRGLADAWSAARKIQDTGGNLNWWIHNVSAPEAIEKIRQHEQEKEEIKVGDEVTPRETEYDDMIVTRLWKDDYDSDCIDAIGFDGRIGSFLMSRVSKTGKHYEIAEVLEKMRGGQDG